MFCTKYIKKKIYLPLFYLVVISIRTGKSVTSYPYIRVTDKTRTVFTIICKENFSFLRFNQNM